MMTKQTNTKTTTTMTTTMMVMIVVLLSSLSCCYGIQQQEAKQQQQDVLRLSTTNLSTSSSTIGSRRKSYTSTSTTKSTSTSTSTTTARPSWIAQQQRQKYRAYYENDDDLNVVQEENNNTSNRKLASCSIICRYPFPKNIKQYRKCVKRRQLGRCLIRKAKSINVCANCKNRSSLRGRIKCFKNDCGPGPKEGGNFGTSYPRLGQQCPASTSNDYQMTRKQIIDTINENWDEWLLIQQPTSTPTTKSPTPSPTMKPTESPTRKPTKKPSGGGCGYFCRRNRNNRHHRQMIEEEVATPTTKKYKIPIHWHVVRNSAEMLEDGQWSDTQLIDGMIKIKQAFYNSSIDFVYGNVDRPIMPKYFNCGINDYKGMYIL